MNIFLNWIFWILFWIESFLGLIQWKNEFSNFTYICKKFWGNLWKFKDFGNLEIGNLTFSENWMARQSILRILPLFRLWTGELISAEKVYSLIAKQMSPSLLFGFILSQPFPPSWCSRKTLRYMRINDCWQPCFLQKGQLYPDLFEFIRQPPTLFYFVFRAPSVQHQV